MSDLARNSCKDSALTCASTNHTDQKRVDVGGGVGVGVGVVGRAWLCLSSSLRGVLLCCSCC